MMRSVVSSVTFVITSAVATGGSFRPMTRTFTRPSDRFVGRRGNIVSHVPNAPKVWPANATGISKALSLTTVTMKEPLYAVVPEPEIVISSPDASRWLVEVTRTLDPVLPYASIAAWPTSMIS